MLSKSCFLGGIMKTQKIKKNLDVLKQLVAELKVIGTAASLLAWDQEVYMPVKGIKVRGKQLAYLSSLSHVKLISKQVGNAIKELKECKDDLDLKERALLRTLSHDYFKSIKVPKELVSELTETTTLAQRAWENAKNKSDFKIFSPYLSKIVKLKQRTCELIGFKDSPYDVLLDDYEPDITEKILDPLFSNLRDETVKLLKKIESSKTKVTEHLNLKLAIDDQKRLGQTILSYLGYELDAGRLDEAVHPFTIGMGSGDVRITTHYYEADFTKALYSTIHECGHALYEQGFDKVLELSGLDEAVSLGIHESQSRTWENIIGRSPEFIKFLLLQLRKMNTSALKGNNPENVVQAINKVKPSLIRIYADEITYNLHIILRYEIEKDLIKGKVKVHDLPELWNSKMKKYLGIMPKKDSEGVLQDVHWSHGSFGYFPTYSLGNIYASQFFAALRKHVSNVDQKITKGDFKPILQWMRDKIHKYGAIYTPSELCKRATGSELNIKDYIEYLTNKYSRIYKV